jgi:hypothetical protein
MKKFIKKLFGIDKLEKEKEEAIARLEQANAREEAAKEAERIANLVPKDRATARGEPWVAVLDTHVNKDNIRNGFFELDWNDIFVQELIESGYGYEADPPEQIVDRWFRDLARNMLAEEGVDPNRSTSGYINVSKISKTQSEIS